MNKTGSHIHFPDSNRTSCREKSNQVSLSGSEVGVEEARIRVRVNMEYVSVKISTMLSIIIFSVIQLIDAARLIRSNA